jgi:hypothetical protein
MWLKPGGYRTYGRLIGRDGTQVVNEHLNCSTSAFGKRQCETLKRTMHVSGLGHEYVDRRRAA